MSDHRVHRCEALSLNDRTIVNNGDGWQLFLLQRQGANLLGLRRPGISDTQTGIRPMLESVIADNKCPECGVDLEVTD